jgi:hypothetical protein
MTTTIAELEQRVAALERELSSLRHLIETRLTKVIPAADGDEEQDYERNHEELAAGWKRFMEETGIRGKPIGAEALQARILASGIKPEDNAFSRGIIEMREE